MFSNGRELENILLVYLTSKLDSVLVEDPKNWNIVISRTSIEIIRSMEKFPSFECL